MVRPGPHPGAVVSGEYERLVATAQADPDGDRRQEAMAAIALIAPYVSGEAMAGADAQAAAVLARLYPPPGPGPGPEPPAPGPGQEPPPPPQPAASLRLAGPRGP